MDINLIRYNSNGGDDNSNLKFKNIIIKKSKKYNNQPDVWNRI